MKSLRKLNIFRSNKHHQQKEDKENKENKEHLDASYHVRFDDNIKLQKQAPKRRRSITDLSNPASAYHVPTQPRAHRPTRSCFEQIQSHEPPSSSDDDQGTLIDDRASSYRVIKPRKKATCSSNYRFQQQKFQIDLNGGGGMQTSSEYGSGGSPMSDNFEAHIEKEQRLFYQERGDRVDYWKNKYRRYKSIANEFKNEITKLKEREKNYLLQANFYKDLSQELTNLREQNRHLQCQLQNLDDFRNLRQNPYMHQQAYPMLPPFPQLMSMNQPLNIDAGEKLVSQAQLPSGGYSGSNISASLGHGLHHNRFDHDDELKDFRKNQTQSSGDDTFDAPRLSISSSSIEHPRRQLLAIEASPPSHERSASCVILNDDGYSTNHSNQTLAVSSNSEQKTAGDSTPVKPASKCRKPRFRSTGSL